MDAVDFINEKTNNFSPEIGIILGSGLGELADEYCNCCISYNDIPNFLKSTVAGHKGRLVFSEINGKKVIMMQGRNHYYEGHAMQDITYPIKVMRKLGVKTLILTNAAGAVNKSYKPADLMIITDHINFMGNNPLIGKNLDLFGPRFPDMSNAYNKELRKIAKNVANSINIDIKEGVYAMMSGPTYETPAEINMIRTLGGDAVGMSTVPEVIVANHCGIKVIGISCMTNMAAGILEQPLNHEEVIETSNKVKNNFIKFMETLIKEI